MSCVFCEIVAGRLPHHVVYEDPAVIAFLTIEPATRGHTLVVPREHADDLLSISESAMAAVGVATARVARLIESAFNPAGITTLQANRPAGWQSVFHFHTHVVPRYQDDGLVEPWTNRRAPDLELASAAAEMRTAESSAPHHRHLRS